MKALGISTCGNSFMLPSRSRSSFMCANLKAIYIPSLTSCCSLLPIFSSFSRNTKLSDELSCLCYFLNCFIVHTYLKMLHGNCNIISNIDTEKALLILMLNQHWCRKWKEPTHAAWRCLFKAFTRWTFVKSIFKNYKRKRCAYVGKNEVVCLLQSSTVSYSLLSSIFIRQ